MTDTPDGIPDPPDAPDDVRTLARDLVATPSHEDETAAGDLLEAWLREATDAAVTRDAHGNVLAARAPDGEPVAPPAAGDEAGDRPILALVGHHDVVPPDGSQVAGEAVKGDAEYVVETRDGRLHGRGSADMKGSLAALACAFRDAALPDGGPRLVFASVVGEGSTGYSADGVTDVAVAHKGRRASTLVAHGQAAHASEPEQGDNAVYHAADAVDVVRDLDAPTATVLGHDLAGSVAVTGIEGGDAWNVIPERCEVTVDERTVPGDRADLERTANDAVDWTVDQDLPPMACRDEAFADAALAAARAAHAAESDPISDATPEHVVKPHATDAGWLADRAGTDCVVYGAAEPGEAHTADESVSLAVLDRCYRGYRLVAASFDGGD